MKIVTAQEMREVDRATSQRFAVPSLTLMENAGTAVAEFVVSQYPSAMRVAVLCGKGNNGGDGFVAARKLHQAGRNVQAILLADPAQLDGDAAEAFRRLPIKAVAVQSIEDLRRHTAQTEIFVDAILGSGFRPPVRGFYAEAIEFLNSSPVPIVAIDIPSGADSDEMTPQQGTIGRADAIVTFTVPRPAHVFGALTNGPTDIAEIGSPDDAIVSSLHLNVIAARDIAPLLAARPADANKGSFGHVVVVGGSLGKAGAAAMAGISALRAGAGLSTVATAKSILPTVAGFHPELMTEPLAETEDGTIADSALTQIKNLSEKKSVVAIGPGISRNEQTSQFVRALVSQLGTAIVLDADGLNAFEGRGNELNGRNRTLVITPHPGEMARLAGCSVADVQKDRLGVARRFASEHDLIVVLKGHRTLIVKPDGEAWANTTGNPGMATGGTGDILTGIVAGMVAQNPKNTFEAVLAAVHLHGLAGDIACQRLGEHSLIATDLLSGLPEAFRRTTRAAKFRTVRF